MVHYNIPHSTPQHTVHYIPHNTPQHTVHYTPHINYYTVHYIPHINTPQHSALYPSHVSQHTVHTISLILHLSIVHYIPHNKYTWVLPPHEGGTGADESALTTVDSEELKNGPSPCLHQGPNLRHWITPPCSTSRDVWPTGHGPLFDSDKFQEHVLIWLT